MWPGDRGAVITQVNDNFIPESVGATEDAEQGASSCWTGQWGDHGHSPVRRGQVGLRTRDQRPWCRANTRGLGVRWAWVSVRTLALSGPQLHGLSFGGSWVCWEG